MRLTKRAIDAIKPDGRDVIHWCESLPGFGLRTNPGGKWTFVVQYRNEQGVSRRKSLGPYGRLTPDQARTEAKRLLGGVALGADPAELAKEARKAITVAELCAEYLEQCDAGLILGRNGKPKRPNTIYTDKSRINRHIIPLLGKKLVKNVTTSDIDDFWDAVATGKTAITERTGPHGLARVTGGRGAARRTGGLLGGIFAYAAKGSRYIDKNPVIGAKRGTDKKRQFRLELEGWRAFGQALDAAEAAGKRWQFVESARLLALTGCRRGEVTDLQWAEVAFGEACLRFTEARLEDGIKSGAIRPLGKPALDLLRRLHDAAPRDKRGKLLSEYVFPATKALSGPYGGLPKAWRLILPDYSPHSLRHAFASVCDDCGLSETTNAALLGHAKGGSVTKGYISKADAALIAAADEVAGFIWEAMS